MWKIFAAILLLGQVGFTNENSLSLHPVEAPPLRWQILADSPESSFEWSLDPESKKINFRRCDAQVYGVMTCKKPMLSQGIDPQDLSLLLQYYCEKLSAAGGHKLNQIIGVATGSLVGVSAYMGTMGLLMKFVPANIDNMLVYGSYHVVTMGGILALIYYVWRIESTRARQRIIADRFNAAVQTAGTNPPMVHISSQKVFEEFSSSFRLALWEFTHNGAISFSADSNLILQ